MSTAAVDRTNSTLVLGITGMTCASCVRRVERTLAKVPGVAEANVNLATEKAQVHFDPDLVDVRLLAQAIERAGYHVGSTTDQLATRATSPQQPADEDELARAKDIRELKTRSFVSLGIGLGHDGPDVPAAPPRRRLVAPVLLIPATFVQVWAGGRFYQAAWAAAKHGGTNMDTLVAVGTSVGVRLQRLRDPLAGPGREAWVPAPPLLTNRP